jgi:hypothetical protein
MTLKNRRKFWGAQAASPASAGSRQLAETGLGVDSNCVRKRVAGRAAGNYPESFRGAPQITMLWVP